MGIVVLALLAAQAGAATYTSVYGGSPTYSISVQIGSSHTFGIDNCPSGYRVDWFIAYSGGGLMERDTASIIAPPRFNWSFPNPGTQWIRADIFTDASVYVGTHRWQVVVQAPDLTSHISLSSGDGYQPGDTISGTVNVSNVGDAPSASGYVDLFFNLGSPSYNTSDRIDHKFYAPISPGSSSNQSFSYAIPSEAPPGTYYLTSMADATYASTESSEGNNTYQKTVIVLEADKPDLVVQDIWTEPSPVVAGEGYVVKARILNQGTAVASSLFGSLDAEFLVNGGYVGNATFNYLGTNETVVVQTGTLTAPSPGNHAVSVMADAGYEVDEASEGNNYREESFNVTAPDLVVQDIWTEPATVYAGEAYVIKATIRNQGGAVADAGLFANQVARFRVDGGTVATPSYDYVLPGSSVTVQTGTLTAPSASSYSLQVVADDANAIVELSEGNNGRTETLSVQQGMPDLVVQSITIDPGYAWRPSTITAVITNIGSATADFGLFDRVCRIEVDGQVQYDTRLFSSLSIAPGGSYSAVETFTVSGPGSLAVTVLADPDNEVLESNEGNNSRTESKVWTASTTHDTDGDGMVDADEVIAGSEPDNVSNVWKCASVATNGGFMLAWPSISDRWYAVERSFNLADEFVVIASNLPATPPQNSYQDTTTSNAFYRIEVSQ